MVKIKYVEGTRKTSVKDLLSKTPGSVICFRYPHDSKDICFVHPADASRDGKFKAFSIVCGVLEYTNYADISLEVVELDVDIVVKDYAKGESKPGAGKQE